MPQGEGPYVRLPAAVSAVRAVVVLCHRDARGRLNVVLQAKRSRTGRGDAQPWRVGFAHPLSAFQTFCVLLALHTG